MKIIYIILLSFTCTIALADETECQKPSAPEVFEKSNITRSHITDAKNKIKAYQETLASYRTCLNNKLSAISKEEKKADKKALKLHKLNNKSVEEETALIEKYQDTVRIFNGE